jgi:predicted kinase
MQSNPGIILITGAMAAGKSTVAQRLAESLPRSVHLRGDVFRRMIVNGQAAITPDGWDDAQSQLHLRYDLAIDAAKTYVAAGFTVVYQDVILGPDLHYVSDRLAGTDHRIVVLSPSPIVLAQRDRDRNKTGYADWTPEELDRSLRQETPRLGLWLDTSDLTVDETVARIREVMSS